MFSIPLPVRKKECYFGMLPHWPSWCILSSRYYAVLHLLTHTWTALQKQLVFLNQITYNPVIKLTGDDDCDSDAVINDERHNQHTFIQPSSLWTAKHTIHRLHSLLVMLCWCRDERTMISVTSAPEKKCVSALSSLWTEPCLAHISSLYTGDSGKFSCHLCRIMTLTTSNFDQTLFLDYITSQKHAKCMSKIDLLRTWPTSPTDEPIAPGIWRGSC